MAQAVLVLEGGGGAGDVALERGAQVGRVVRVGELEPGLGGGLELVLAVAEHAGPARRVVHVARLQVPVPQAVVGAHHGQLVARLALAQRLVAGDQLAGAVREADRHLVECLRQQAQLAARGDGQGHAEVARRQLARAAHQVGDGLGEQAATEDGGAHQREQEDGHEVDDGRAHHDAELGGVVGRRARLRADARGRGRLRGGSRGCGRLRAGARGRGRLRGGPRGGGRDDGRAARAWSKARTSCTAGATARTATTTRMSRARRVCRRWRRGISFMAGTPRGGGVARRTATRARPAPPSGRTAPPACGSAGRAWRARWRRGS